MISIKGLNKAEVLKVLYDNAKPLGLGILSYNPEPMTIEEAENILKTTMDFDYLQGRVMKVNISKDEFREDLYDRDNGEGSAKKAIDSITPKATRVKTVCISERTLMKAIGGQLFDQAPNRQPRKVDVIMTKVRDTFRKDAVNDKEYYTLNIPVEDRGVLKYVDKLLKDIPEFEELNLSQLEFEKGIKVDDESRPKFAFCTR